MLQTQSAGGAGEGSKFPWNVQNPKSVLPPPEHMVLSEEPAMGQLRDILLSSLKSMPYINNGRQGLTHSHKIPDHRLVFTEICTHQVLALGPNIHHQIPCFSHPSLETHPRQGPLSPSGFSVCLKEYNYESKPSSPGTKVSSTRSLWNGSRVQWGTQTA